jgi:hypothetical protein
MAAWRRRTLLSMGGLSLALLAVGGLVASQGWAWGWFVLVAVIAGGVWGLTRSEAQVWVLPYLHLLAEAYDLENVLYIADSKSEAQRLTIVSWAGERHPYQVREINAGAGLDWNTEAGRQNLAATILAAAVDGQSSEDRAMAGRLVNLYAPKLEMNLFWYQDRSGRHLRDNCTITRQAVVNFAANQL